MSTETLATIRPEVRKIDGLDIHIAVSAKMPDRGAGVAAVSLAGEPAQRAYAGPTCIRRKRTSPRSQMSHSQTPG